MSVPQEQLFQTVLALPQAQRADLAFQLLQTLSPPGEELSAQDYGNELRSRVIAHRKGEIQSFSLEETRAYVERLLPLA